MSAPGLDSFVSWFQRNNGFIDTQIMGFCTFAPSEGGRGAVALKDIPEGQVLFSIPRSLTLSIRNSSLPKLLGPQLWREKQLDKGWIGLILCMMWENAQGPSSKWAEYLEILPKKFDTPMFWDENDLQELKGTYVVDKLGKEDAERDYNEKLLPIVRSRPDLFSAESIVTYYSLEQYHIMGSRILSRSFDVERWEGDSENDSDQNNIAADTSVGSAIDVDLPAPSSTNDSDPDEQNSDDEDEEDQVDVSMVPVADLLNARYGTENAKLFYEPTELKMLTTKPIAVGEQIWNTYGDLPNAELLRRYGHVDLMELSGGGKGNPGDVVEIRADVVVSVLFERPGTFPENRIKAIIDWYLEEGGDDVLVIEADMELPPQLLTLIRLFLLSPEEFKKAQDKGKPPKNKVDLPLLDIAIRVLQLRSDEFLTSVDTDEALLVSDLTLNKYHATVVRLGEKKILWGALKKAKELRSALVEQSKGTAGSETTSSKNKRKITSDGPPSKKSKK
ncbi:SET domain-containing protein [Dendrothele bispora CBS 962.96]|uniref:Ribosomal lysine N-methyltransferase 4 n=1 Tax=Dendrothele bispora (strain CBS 962.96) TaxID=1314807 RepID=A0A4S8M3K2_DENBC|nr:SET domain-containing protein [Dendrothele bispora CBS 962.96]